MPGAHVDVSAPVASGNPVADDRARASRIAIEVSGVHKEFVTADGSIQEVLSNISCTFIEGQLTCLLGPTGCGKSTLLNLIAGFIPPTSGRITAHGRDVTEPSRE